MSTEAAASKDTTPPATTTPEVTPAGSDVASSHNEKEIKENIEDPNEPVAHLHAKTYLTVFSVCFIYFAQLINVVAAGAVSLRFPHL